MEPGDEEDLKKLKTLHEEAQHLKRLALLGVAISTFATCTAVILLPMLHNYTQHVQSVLQDEADYCWHRADDLSQQLFGLGAESVENYSLHLRGERSRRSTGYKRGSGISGVNTASEARAKGATSWTEPPWNMAVPSGYSSIPPAAPFPVFAQPWAKSLHSQETCSCAVGEVGLSGPPGADGYSGADGHPGKDGQAGDDAPEGTVPILRDFCFDCPEGSRGPPGPQGEKGIQGEKGPSGMPAPDSPPGFCGEPGPEGASGLSGSPGDVYVCSMNGPPGPRGLLMEVPGRIGAAGVPGLVGTRGLDGEVGIPGKLGPQGPRGLKGDTGCTGRPGSVGKGGERGRDGLAGERGSCDHCPSARTAPGY